MDTHTSWNAEQRLYRCFMERSCTAWRCCEASNIFKTYATRIKGPPFKARQDLDYKQGNDFASLPSTPAR
uniref:Uncharacterized protein n=1 Tax=Oryza barthii TaxID=65489 RepID=A0A0D3HGN1_9ORYZ